MSVSRILLAIILFNCLFLRALAGDEPINTGPENSKTLKFIENKGQVHNQLHEPQNDVLFSGHDGQLVFHLKNQGISYQMQKVLSTKTIDEPAFLDDPGLKVERPDQLSIYRIDINWINSNPSFGVEYGTSTTAISNYYLSHCPEGVTDVRSFNDVTFKELYTGIDVHFYSKKAHMEYDFIIAPQADPNQIQWNIDGADEVYIDKKGDLVIITPMGVIKEDAPIAFQGNRQVSVKWAIENGKIGFEIGHYDENLPLVIDPLVRLWGTYFGGSDWDIPTCLVRNASGDLFMGGDTFSAISIATTGSHQINFGGFEDAFVARFDSQGMLVWCTYYGGTSDEYAWDLALDASSNVFVVGHTTSTNGISSVGVHQINNGGGSDAFVAKFSAAGVRLWGTYYGGTGNDWGNGVTIDGSGDVYFSGETYSTNGISTTGCHQAISAGSDDAFLVKFNTNGVRQWGTYYGGTGIDYGFRCYADGMGNIYLPGGTESSSGIATIGAYNTIYVGARDAFVAVFNTNGVRQMGTYYGGSDFDKANNVFVDANGAIYLVGSTASGGSPLVIASASSHQPSYGGGSSDGFIVKLNNNVREWGTYYGGMQEDWINKITADVNGNLIICGGTYSSDAVSTNDAYQPTFGGTRDVMLAKFDSNGVRAWATFYGGIMEDVAWDVQVDNNENIYFTGFTNSPSNIASIGSHQPSFIGGAYDGFLVKMHDCNVAPNNLTESACKSYLSPSGGHTWTVSGTYSDTMISSFGCDSVLNITLTVTHPDTSVSQNGSILTAAGSGSYQWIDCGNNSPVSGANGQVFNPTANGSYALVITEGTCSDTSACFDVSTVGLTDNPLSAFRIYPNPVDDLLTVEFGQLWSHAELVLRNEMGQIVYQKSVEHEHTSVLNLSDYSKGVYLLSLTTVDGHWHQRIVKQ